MTERDWIKAFEYYDRALALSPDDTHVLDSLSQNLLEVGYYAEANAASQRVVLLDPLVALYRNTLGRTYYFLGGSEKAKEQFEKTVLINPTMPFPYNNLWRYYLDKGDIDKAAGVGERAVKAGAIPDQALEGLYALKQAWGDEVALRDLLGRFDGALDNEISRALRDDDTLVANLEARWNADYRPSAEVFTESVSGLNKDHPRWKEQVRRDAIFDLWKTRGFPAQCRAKGADDFECD